MNVLSQVGLRWRQVRHTNTWFTAAVLASFVAIEVLGRFVFTSDAHDWLAMGLVMLVAHLSFERHKRSRLKWLHTAILLGTRVRDSWKRFAFKAGVDLRLEPPIPARMPPGLRLLIVPLAILAGVLAITAPIWPHGLRAGAVVSYVVYVAVLGLLWAVMAFGWVVSFVVMVMLTRDLLVLRRLRATAEPKRSIREATVRATTLMLVGLALAAIFVPVWVATSICLLCIVITGANLWFYRHPQATFLWRGNTGGEIHSMNLRMLNSLDFTIITLATLALIFITRGGAALGMGTPDSWLIMPITATLGTVTAWCGAFALGFVTTQRLLMFQIARRHDPSVPTRPVVHASGEVALKHRAELKAVLYDQGFEVRFDPVERRPTDVPIVLVEPPMPKPDLSEHSRWPMAVSLPALRAPELIEIMHRRDQVHKRRLLLRGLEKLFKRAAKYKFAKGTGFLVAPHIWFSFGLTRDEDDDDWSREDEAIMFSTIGPPYYRVFAREVRNHLWVVLRALEVDLIFVEDGIEFRKFKTVLRMIFEQYDIHQGAQRLEDRHFFGIPGIRVMLHEFALDEPFKSDTYPEPEYRELGRARILHVFKDRGLGEEMTDEPLDITNIPMPVGAL